MTGKYKPVLMLASEPLKYAECASNFFLQSRRLFLISRTIFPEAIFPRVIIRWASLLFLLVSPSVIADNLTISDTYTSGGPEMSASPLSCDGVADQAYLQVATLAVSADGDYEIADAGNLLGFTESGQGVVDVVVSIYEDSFDPGNAATNRVATIDEGQLTPLETGRSYLLVIQPYCEDISGVFAIVVRGSGTISGAGFNSDTFTHGQHSPADDVADFPQGIGMHAYDVSAPVQVPESGLYYFGDVGVYFNADLALLAYEGSFNPGNTSANLAGVATFSGNLNLDKNKTYVFVTVDLLDLEGNWQYVLFPPGEMRFNQTLKGSWVTPGVSGSGILMEIFPQSGILFFAWFTFPDVLPTITLEKNKISPQATVGTVQNADLGSSDQRWLTGFGAIPADSNTMNIRYENTSGGVFNQTTPVPTTDSNYGVGTVTVTDCSNLEVTYDLTTGIVGMAPMVRITADALVPCLESVNAGVVTSLL